MVKSYIEHMPIENSNHVLNVAYATHVYFIYLKNKYKKLKSSIDC